MKKEEEEKEEAPQVLLLYRIAIYAVPSSFLQYAVLSDFSSERCQSKQL